MNSIILKFENDLNSYFKNFLIQISNKHKIHTILDEWETFSENITDGKTTSSIAPIIVIEKSKTVVSEITNNNNCEYIFIKGKNEGTNCPNKVSSGNRFCSKHVKFEQVEQKEKKIIPKIKEKSTKQILMILKGTNYWWHQETRFVFNSTTEKIVIAKYIDGDLQKLTNNDIEICKKYKFNFDQQYNFTKIDDNKNTLSSSSNNGVSKKLISKENESNTNVISKIDDKKKVSESIKINEKDKKNIAIVDDKTKNSSKSLCSEKKCDEIFRTNVCAKHIEDIIGEMFDKDSDDDDNDDDEDDDDDEEDDDDEDDDDDDDEEDDDDEDDDDEEDEDDEDDEDDDDDDEEDDEEEFLDEED